MKIAFRILWCGLWFAVLIVVPVARAQAQDPVKVAPEVYRVLLENDQVRVLEMRLRPGSILPKHSHPAHITYALSDGLVRFTSPNGEDKMINLRAGRTAWSGPATHVVENIGLTEARIVAIELKESPASSGDVHHLAAAGERQKHAMFAPRDLQWRDAPPSLPPGAKMTVLSGDPQKPGPFTLRFQIPAGYRVPSHWHPADEHVTVVSGSIYMGMGDDRTDDFCGTPIPTGGFVMMPAREHHFAWSDEGAVIQIHGIGPWGINYLNPDDDPRTPSDPYSLDD